MGVLFAKAAEEVGDEGVIANPGIAGVLVFYGEGDYGNVQLGSEAEGAGAQGEQFVSRFAGGAFGEEEDGVALLQLFAHGFEGFSAAFELLSFDEEHAGLSGGKADEGPMSYFGFGDGERCNISEYDNGVEIGTVVTDEETGAFFGRWWRTKTFYTRAQHFDEQTDVLFALIEGVV